MDKSKFKNKSEWRKFGISVGLILVVIATLQLILGKNLYVYFYSAGALFALLGFLAPIVIKPIFILFSYLGSVMGWFMTRVILTIFFYGIMTPFSLLMKLGRKNFLDLRFASSAESYWRDRDSETAIKNYENQF